MPAGRNEQADRGPHRGREFMLFGTREKVSQRGRNGEGKDVRDGFADGGSAERELRKDKGKRRVETAGAGKQRIYFAFRAQGRKHRYGEELFLFDGRGERAGGKVRDADHLLHASAEREIHREEEIYVPPAGEEPETVRVQRLQPVADGSVLLRVGQRDAAGRERVLPLERGRHRGGVHQNEHGAAGGDGKGRVHSGGDRERTDSAGCGNGGEDAGKRRFRGNGARLRVQRIGQSGENYPELHRHRKQNGLAEVKRKSGQAPALF